MNDLRTIDQSTDGDGPEPFSFIAGAYCLDLVNSLEDRLGEPRELLNSYGDLVRWSLEAGSVSTGEAEMLLATAEEHPRAASAVLKRAIALREAIFDLFRSLADGRPEAPASLEVLNGELAASMAHTRIFRSGENHHWGWEPEPNLSRPLWPIARSAADLLTSDGVDRVRVCSADDCEWLFLDLSRNRSKRWCDMSTCGNREKVRRFRQSK